VRERRVLLETYLRSILTHRDDRWRSSYTFSDFLAVPHSSSRNNAASSSSTNTSSSGVQGPPEHFTPSNWLAEHGNLQTLLRLTRSALLKRDALAGMGDAAGSRGASVEAKKLLREVGDRVEGLEKGLGGTAGGIGEGEKRRREEKVEGVKEERGNLQRMAEAGVRSSGFNRDSPTPNASHTSAGSGTGAMPGGTGSLWAPPPGSGPAPGRVFGSRQPPQETSETRPLDDRGLVQLQQNQMTNQDDQLQELSKLLQKQRVMGEEIHREIGEQNEMLDDVDTEVGKVGNKMGKAKRQMNRLN